ncbi:hypothetical protein GCM10023185_22670 [Hymenobacter saemangeumensis]|uniref:PH domain-containing protein n=1 Tax=Hymenobacter saemangeumensis TaxID=1084522 RepID=A0ABP8IFH1_9BACT
MKTSFLRPLLEAAVLLMVLLGGLRWVLGLFSRNTHVYQPTAGRQLRLAFWSALALGCGLSVVPAVALKDEPANKLEWVLAAGFGAVVLALGGPALLLHLRYWRLNQATAVVFQPQENRLEVYEAGQRIPFAQRDLRRVERVTCSARHSFWASYDYLRLHLADGRVITLTSLLTNLEPLTQFLRSTPTDRRSVAWCWV